jgi:hypothetical protein
MLTATTTAASGTATASTAATAANNSLSEHVKYVGLVHGHELSNECL